MQRSARLVRSARAGPSTFARLQSTSAPPTASASFTPALPAGQNAAYDASLAFLSAHTTSQLARLDGLRASLSAAAPAARPALEARIARLEVDACINDPATRRTFRETLGVGHMDKAVVRALARRRWEREGGRDLLMQRVLQLAVIPDLLPGIDADAALTLTPSAAHAALEPGSIHPPSTFASPPRATLQLFDHPSPATSSSAPTAHYTLAVIDPDCPAPETQSYTQHLHYLKRNIPLSVLDGETDLFAAAGTETIGWQAPAPPQGSGKHRYVFVVLRQSSSAAPEAVRDAFDLRAYVAAANATPVAVSLFRSAWTPAEAEFVSGVYAAQGNEEPKFGRPDKSVRYAYPLSSKAERFEEVRREAWESVVGELQGGEARL
ncbi:mitochondrial 54S ribosomal protein YmL35 [Cryptotrichosporon argae]